MYASHSHSYTHLILALGIVRKPTVWGLLLQIYPGIHDTGLPIIMIILSNTPDRLTRCPPTDHRTVTVPPNSIPSKCLLPTSSPTSPPSAVPTSRPSAAPTIPLRTECPQCTGFTLFARKTSFRTEPVGSVCML